EILPQRERPKDEAEAIETKTGLAGARNTHAPLITQGGLAPMATQQSIPQSLTVVPFPAPQQISQLELSLLISLRGRLAQLEGQVENAEQSIKTRLEKGCSVEEGDHVALLKPTNRRNVAWKAIVERLRDRLFGPG